ncbi:MAG: shikimate kinase [Ruminococcus sp.]|jgi:shikimate kinase|nr:shikimate kinase [Ruminococcus sp.]
MNSIVLSGFMCCGKTTAGQKLSSRTGLDFYDLDAEIEKKMNAPVPEIFRDWGEKVFREQEAAILRSLCTKQCVIAAGGGAFADSKNYGTVKLSSGFVVFIDTPFEICYKRILRDSGRPLAEGKTREEMLELYNTRRALYEKNCDAVVSGNAPSLLIIAEIMQEVVRLIDEKTGAEIDQINDNAEEKNAEEKIAEEKI